LNPEIFCFGGFSPQKLLLAQLTSAKKVLSSVNESPDTSFEYVPPKVNLHLKKKKWRGKKKGFRGLF